MIKVEWNYRDLEHSKVKDDPIYLKKGEDDMSITAEEAEMLIVELRSKLDKLA